MIKTSPSEIEMILQSSAENVGFDPHVAAFVLDLPVDTSKGIPACALFVLGFDSYEAAVAVANEAKRMSDPRRGLSAHVCTGHGLFKRLSIVTLI
jgi:hypothetical protein